MGHNERGEALPTIGTYCSKVGRVGVEPTRVAPADFKSAASAIPPPSHRALSTLATFHSSGFAWGCQSAEETAKNSLVKASLRDPAQD